MRACAGSINGGVPMVSCVGGALGGGACRVCGRRGRARARAVALASCAGPSGTEAHCIERGEQRDQSGKESSELSERAAESLQEWRSSSLFSSQRRLLPRMTSSSHASARHAALSLSFTAQLLAFAAPPSLLLRSASRLRRSAPTAPFSLAALARPRCSARTRQKNSQSQNVAATTSSARVGVRHMRMAATVRASWPRWR